MANNVLTRRNLKDWNAVAEDELMELPPAFVLAADFCTQHDKFMFVRRYIKYNWRQLNMEEKQQLLLQCDLSELGSKDLKMLCKLDVLDTKELNAVLCAIVDKMENKLEQQAKELRASEQERAEQSTKIDYMEKQLEQQVKELPMEKLCIALKSQVPIKHLELSRANLHTINFVFSSLFPSIKSKPNRQEDSGRRSKSTERGIESQHNTQIPGSVL